MSNFAFLLPDFPSLHRKAVQAEKRVFTEPPLCGFLCRQLLEMAVLHIYQVRGWPIFEGANAYTLTRVPAFRRLIADQPWATGLRELEELGGSAGQFMELESATTERALRHLFDFLRWFAWVHAERTPELPSTFEPGYLGAENEYLLSPEKMQAEIDRRKWNQQQEAVAIRQRAEQPASKLRQRVKSYRDLALAPQFPPVPLARQQKILAFPPERKQLVPFAASAWKKVRQSVKRGEGSILLSVDAGSTRRYLLELILTVALDPVESHRTLWLVQDSLAEKIAWKDLKTWSAGARLWVATPGTLLSQLPHEMPPDFFDLIIVEEGSPSERATVFQYGAILEHFDAFALGLTTASLKSLSREVRSLWRRSSKVSPSGQFRNLKVTDVFNGAEERISVHHKQGVDAVLNAWWENGKEELAEMGRTLVLVSDGVQAQLVRDCLLDYYLESAAENEIIKVSKEDPDVFSQLQGFLSGDSPRLFIIHDLSPVHLERAALENLILMRKLNSQAEWDQWRAIMGNDHSVIVDACRNNALVGKMKP